MEILTIAFVENKQSESLKPFFNYLTFQNATHPVIKSKCLAQIKMDNFTFGFNSFTFDNGIGKFLNLHHQLITKCPQ